MANLGTVGVIGGSLAGLLAARALSEHAERVVIYEKDELPNDASARKSVPQGTHPHVLLAAGAEVLDRWFPDLFERVTAAGGLHADMSGANNWFHFAISIHRLSPKSCGPRSAARQRRLNALASRKTEREPWGCALGTGRTSVVGFPLAMRCSLGKTSRRIPPVRGWVHV